jgi:hypothetical protein
MLENLIHELVGRGATVGLSVEMSRSRPHPVPIYKITVSNKRKNDYVDFPVFEFSCGSRDVAKLCADVQVKMQAVSSLLDLAEKSRAEWDARIGINYDPKTALEHPIAFPTP